MSAKGSRGLVAVALIIVTAVTGCDRGGPASGATTATPSPDASAPAPLSGTVIVNIPDGDGTSGADGGVATGGPARAALLQAQPLEAASIGHTSVVFKLKLEGGGKAAWKPRSRRGASRYKGEIAAYRLAVALGLPNVPPAFPRAFPLARLQAIAPPGTPARTLLDEEAVPEGGALPGALIPWLPRFEEFPLERPEWQRRFRPWLAKGGAPPEGADLALAAQISDLLVFDALISNWDRWSGGNVAVHRGADGALTLLFVDNDGAFLPAPPKAELAQAEALLEATWRFSRSLVDHLEALDEGKLTTILGDEGPGVPLLAPDVVKRLDERRARIVGSIRGKARTDGAERVLVFP